MESFAGIGAVITGGASGIGFATARQLLAEGARVVIADIEKQKLDTAVEELGSSIGVVSDAKVHGQLCDVTKLEDVKVLAEMSFDTLGTVDLTFHNAGVATFGPIAAMSHDDWRWVIDVDLWGPIHGVEAFVPRMIEHGRGGHILFTSSIAGLTITPGLGPYTVAKFGVVALAETLRFELKRHGIGVSVLCPLGVATDIMTSARNRDQSYGPTSTDAAKAAREVFARSEDAPPVPMLSADVVAARTLDAVKANRMFVFPHPESRALIRRRFDLIDETFDLQN